MRWRLAIAATGIVLACTGCGLVTSEETDWGTMEGTVTYEDDSGPQHIDVSIDSIACNFVTENGGFTSFNTGDGQHVDAIFSEGKPWFLSIRLGREALYFESPGLFDLTDDGAMFTDLPGEVVQFQIDGAELEDVTTVDPAATLTGTVTCP